MFGAASPAQPLTSIEGANDAALSNRPATTAPVSRPAAERHWSRHIGKDRVAKPAFGSAHEQEKYRLPSARRTSNPRRGGPVRRHPPGLTGHWYCLTQTAYFFRCLERPPRTTERPPFRSLVTMAPMMAVPVVAMVPIMPVPRVSRSDVQAHAWPIVATPARDAPAAARMAMPPTARATA